MIKNKIKRSADGVGSNGYPANGKIRDSQKYFLRLFITGTTPKSTRAVANLKNICEEYFDEQPYDLEIIDIYQQPEMAREEQILAVPTLIKKKPLPLRRLIGDLSNVDSVLSGLNLASTRIK